MIILFPLVTNGIYVLPAKRAVIQHNATANKLTRMQLDNISARFPGFHVEPHWQK
ncbi:hypothetical protein OO184_03970 [Photorhabdus sp. APURE]|uniref:hypothetical protein n=1 Tax=Photorhabdus aballayi TaxID=2991723 RepID=UPI00223D1797|nr:hypothetical protein [Photorhabdus aballayi]MCW7547123.1 hypothetical protein [Photorhabdus aballayi]